MNYEKIIKNNIDFLSPIFVKEYEKRFPNAIIFFAGSGVFLGYPNKKNFIEDYVTFTFSKSKLSALFENSSIEVKSNMSHKVNLLVWNPGAWYHKGEI